MLAARRTIDEQERFQRVFRGHYSDVRRFVTRIVEPDDVDDVVADTFLVAWRRITEMPAEPRVWLLSVARRTASNRRRSARRQRSVSERIATDRPPTQESGSQSSPTMEAFSELGLVDQQTLALVSWHDLNAREAAAVVGCTHAAFRVRLHRARKRLEARLHDDELQAQRASSPLSALPTHAESP